MKPMYTFPMSAFINMANTVAESSLDRMQEMSEKIQKRQYTPSDIITDTLGFWIDGVNGWWSIVQQSVAGPVPFAFIKMATDSETNMAELPIRKSGSEAVQYTDLVRLSGSGNGVPVWIEVNWASAKPNCVRVTAHGLNQKQADAKEKLCKGLYQSSLHMDNKLIGIVQILVD